MPLARRLCKCLPWERGQAARFRFDPDIYLSAVVFRMEGERYTVAALKDEIELLWIISQLCLPSFCLGFGFSICAFA